MFLLNLLLALTWLLLTGQFTPENFVFGFLLGYLLLWIFQYAVGGGGSEHRGLTYFRKVGQIGAFALFFAKELILANVQVATDVLRRRPRMEPAVVTIALPACSDGEVTMLASFITLTPGTLSLDVVDGHSPDSQMGDSQMGDSKPRVLHVHALYAGQTEAAIARFRQQLEQRYVRRVQEVWQ